MKLVRLFPFIVLLLLFSVLAVDDLGSRSLDSVAVSEEVPQEIRIEVPEEESLPETQSTGEVVTTVPQEETPEEQELEIIVAEDPAREITIKVAENPETIPTVQEELVVVEPKEKRVEGASEEKLIPENHLTGGVVADVVIIPTILQEETPVEPEDEIIIANEPAEEPTVIETVLNHLSDAVSVIREGVENIIENKGNDPTEDTPEITSGIGTEEPKESSVEEVSQEYQIGKPKCYCRTEQGPCFVVIEKDGEVIYTEKYFRERNHGHREHHSYHSRSHHFQREVSYTVLVEDDGVVN